VTLAEGEAERLPFADREFDHLTFTYLLRYVDEPGATMRELARVVKPGGRIASLEFCLPRGIWFWPWRLYTRILLPALGRLASRSWFEAGRFLGPSIEGFYGSYPLRRQVELWEAAGILDVEVRRMSLGGGVVIWGTVGG
jgi:demethylmenaquinone methyltransferase/2-methoxy-6-polyprenyl-1,4-benzoquinol methylase